MTTVFKGDFSVDDSFEMTTFLLRFLPAYGTDPSVEMTVKLRRISSGFGGTYGESMADWLT